jgi:hypothetical protein
MRTRTASQALCLCLLLSSSAARPSETGFWSAGGTTLRTAGEKSPAGVGDSSRAYILVTSRGERQVALPAGVLVEELFALRTTSFLTARGAGRDRRDLFLALIDEQGLHALPTPAPGAAGFRENAVPLTSAGGDLEGLVWLEGGDRQSYAVRHAAWDGMRWSEAGIIAEPAPGSQLAVAATTLADGSSLLVWSRFDGHDDEIVAARFANGRWSAPLPIAADNDVPDITPAIIAVPGGALASWSRYDGHEYRIVIARFDGREWSSPAWAGPPGASEPSFSRAPGGDAASRKLLTFVHARPRGWGVLELSASGRVLRQGAVESTASSRPALAVLSGGRVQLRWAENESELELH